MTVLSAVPLLTLKYPTQKHAPKHDPPAGLYRNVIIINTIKECYFKGPKDIGVKFPALFGPIPLEIIAHVVTIVSSFLKVNY
jgi:hypothetical protein